MVPDRANWREGGKPFAMAVGGALLEVQIGHAYPNYPTAAVCASLYWKALIERQSTLPNRQ
jgi:hypothetical protein